MKPAPGFMIPRRINLSPVWVFAAIDALSINTKHRKESGERILPAQVIDSTH